MRRKKGELVPLERSILEVARRLCNEDVEEFYATWEPFRFRLACKVADFRGMCVSRGLTDSGVLYRALIRLEGMGYLKSRWEKLDTNTSRPRRRYYRLTDLGMSSLDNTKSYTTK